MRAHSRWCTRRVGYKEIVRRKAVDQEARWDCSSDRFFLYLARYAISTSRVRDNLWGSHDTITGSRCHLFRLHVPTCRVIFAQLEIIVAPLLLDAEHDVRGSILGDREGGTWMLGGNRVMTRHAR